MHRLAGKSEQTIPANLPRWNPRVKGQRVRVTSSCCTGAMHSGKKSGAVYSG